MRELLIILIIVSWTFSQVQEIPYRVIREIPHDEDAFTQGLILLDGYLWESTGTPGGGTRIRQIDPATGKVLNSTQRIPYYFGEGLTSDGVALYQLSWQKEMLFIFNYPTLEPVGNIPYKGEGWGLTRTPINQFIMSNGSDTIYERDSQFNVVKKIAVRLDGKPLTNLNELEWYNNKLYANIWYSDSIALISPETGNVEKLINLKQLRKDVRAFSHEKVVNGIAAAGDNRFWVTGKFWSKIFLIELKSDKTAPK